MTPYDLTAITQLVDAGMPKSDAVAIVEEWAAAAEPARAVAENELRIFELDDLAMKHMSPLDDVGNRAESEIYDRVKVRPVLIAAYRAARGDR